MREFLFSYGTLQTEKTQLDLFGRKLQGNKDRLIGYKTEMIEITDETFLATGDGRFQRIAIQTNNSHDFIEGTVLELSTEELLNADKYEPRNYKRVLVDLASGKRAWLYIGI